jgi:5-methylcytosine-specific restriction protein A
VNDLIVIYDSMSNNKLIYKKYTRIGKDNLGNKFSFIGTNSRGILPVDNDGSFGGFYQAFKIIKDVESIPRAEWQRTNKAGQEFEKQHTVRMRESVFFRERDTAFQMTSRGSVFEKMIDNSELNAEEKRFLCYLLILPGYFSKTPNYILKRTEEVFEALNSQGISDDEILDSILEIVKASNKHGFKKNDIFKYDYTYFDSFTFDFDNLNFLKHFIESNEQTKNEFKTYIFEQQKINNKKQSILKKKYESGGNYTVTSLIDNAWILYVTKKIIDSAESVDGFETFIHQTIGFYEELFSINKARVNKFIFDTDKNKSVFKVIYSEIFDVPISKFEVEKDLTSEELKKIVVLDSTEEFGRIRSEQVVYSLKKIAKSESMYTCECEDLEGCKYFTSKDNEENFLEIHHLIPREFANDFGTTIEVLSNYVALCPNCHRKIHYAVDREREHMLRSLLNKRKEALAKDGLKIEIKDLFEYYGIKKK